MLSRILYHPSTASFGLYTLTGRLNNDEVTFISKIKASINIEKEEVFAKFLTIINIIGWFFGPVIGTLRAIAGIALYSKDENEAQKEFCKGLIAKGLCEIFLGSFTVIIDLIFTLGRACTTTSRETI